MRLIDADELCNGLLDRWKTADENNEELIKHLMADVVTPIVVSTPTVDVLEQIRDEIDQKQYDFMDDKDYDEGIRFGLMLAYQIIDKYRGITND